MFNKSHSWKDSELTYLQKKERDKKHTLASQRRLAIDLSTTFAGAIWPTKTATGRMLARSWVRHPLACTSSLRLLVGIGRHSSRLLACLLCYRYRRHDHVCWKNSFETDNILIFYHLFQYWPFRPGPMNILTAAGANLQAEQLKTRYSNCAREQNYRTHLPWQIPENRWQYVKTVVLWNDPQATFEGKRGNSWRHLATGAESDVGPASFLNTERDNLKVTKIEILC